MLAVAWKSGEVTIYNHDDGDVIETSLVHVDGVVVFLLWNDAGTRLVSGDEVCLAYTVSALSATNLDVSALGTSVYWSPCRDFIMAKWWARLLNFCGSLFIFHVGSICWYLCLWHG